MGRDIDRECRGQQQVTALRCKQAKRICGKKRFGIWVTGVLKSLARHQRCRDSENFESGKLEIAAVIRAHELKCQVKLFCLVSPWRLTQELIIEGQQGPEVGTT